MYYGIGKYVSENTRNGTWGTDAIKTISIRLKSELVGVRGFSETNIKDMPDTMKKELPDVEELKKILTDSTE